jgi:Sec-independent protein translocase protein TatA
MMPFGYSDMLFTLAIFLVLLGVIKMPELARSLGIYLKQNKNNKSQKQLLKELKKKKMH